MTDRATMNLPAEPSVWSCSAMKVLICGDRNWRDEAAIASCIDALPLGAIIIQGEARGADKIAGRLAAKKGFHVMSFPANWNRYGKAAGPIRNRQMMQEGSPHLTVFFHNNLRQSKGTRDMVKVSVDKGVPVLNGRSISDWAEAFNFYTKLI